MECVCCEFFQSPKVEKSVSAIIAPDPVTHTVRPSQRSSGSTVKNTSVVSTFTATDLNLEEEDGADAVDSAIFQVPQM